MRVLHWYPNFLGGGSIAKAVLGLVQSQARLGVDTGVAAVKPNRPPFHEAIDVGRGVTLLEWESGWTVRADGIVARWVTQEAATALRVFRPDIVHVHGELNPDNLWVPLLFKCPIVLSPHGGFHPMVFTKSPSVFKRLYYLVAKPMLYRRVCAFHALSKLERADLIRLLPSALVYCAPSGPSIRSQLSAPSSEAARPDGVVRFVFVGRLDVFTKGLDFLLEAFAEVEARLRERRQIELTLVGPDWNGGRAWLERRKVKLKIKSRVTFTGAVPGEEVGRILRRSDIYVQLSRYDGYPFSITEALCAGKPAVLSATIGHASYPEVTSLPHVRVVPLGAREAAEAMGNFALRLPEFNTLAEQNHAKAKAFCSWERVAGLHLQIYESLWSGGEAPEKTPTRGTWLPDPSAAVPSIKVGQRTTYQRHGSVGP